MPRTLTPMLLYVHGDNYSIITRMTSAEQTPESILAQTLQEGDDYDKAMAKMVLPLRGQNKDEFILNIKELDIAASTANESLPVLGNLTPEQIIETEQHLTTLRTSATQTDLVQTIEEMDPVALHRCLYLGLHWYAFTAFRITIGDGNREILEGDLLIQQRINDTMKAAVELTLDRDD